MENFSNSDVKIEIKCLKKNNGLLFQKCRIILMISISALLVNFLQFVIMPSIRTSDDQKFDKIINARGFILRNKQGIACAELIIGDDGRPVFAMFDKQGHNRIKIGYSDSERPWFVMYNSLEKGIFVLGDTNSDSPSLEIYDKNHNLKMREYVDELSILRIEKY